MKLNKKHAYPRIALEIENRECAPCQTLLSKNSIEQCAPQQACRGATAHPKQPLIPSSPGHRHFGWVKILCYSHMSSC